MEFRTNDYGKNWQITKSLRKEMVIAASIAVQLKRMLLITFII